MTSRIRTRSGWLSGSQTDSAAFFCLPLRLLVPATFRSSRLRFGLCSRITLNHLCRSGPIDECGRTPYYSGRALLVDSLLLVLLLLRQRKGGTGNGDRAERDGGA